VATGLPPWIQVREESPTGSRWFINLTELVRQHLSDLFPGLETYDHTLFRITRDAEVEWHGDSSESVREVVAERVRLRRYEPAVRIEFGPEALVSASRGGLPIDLVVRGFCCLRPGVPGQTETIRVRSIIGRFLEHARIFYFANGASDPSSGDFYIGSADWMERNLSWRVEVVAPVVAPALRQRLWEILDINLSDCRQAWMMTASGEYRRLEPGPKARGAALDGTHATLMHLTAALATTQTAVVRELQVNRGPGFFFADPGSNASAADVILEERKLT
jgi:polyphosphate kinase